MDVLEKIKLYIGGHDFIITAIPDESESGNQGLELLLPLRGASGQETIATQSYVSNFEVNKLKFLSEQLGIPINNIVSNKDLNDDDLAEIVYVLISRLVEKKIQDFVDNRILIQEHFLDANLDLGLKFNLHSDLGKIELINSEKGHPGILRLRTNSDLKSGKVSLVSNLNEFVLSGTDEQFSFSTCFRYSFNEQIIDVDLEDFIGIGDSDNDIPDNGLGLSIVDKKFVFLKIKDGVITQIETEIEPNVGEWYQFKIEVSEHESFFQLDDEKHPQEMDIESPMGIQYLLNKTSYVEGSIYLDIDYCNVSING